jgi:hypothetical protein
MGVTLYKYLLSKITKLGNFKCFGKKKVKLATMTTPAAAMTTPAAAMTTPTQSFLPPSLLFYSPLAPFDLGTQPEILNAGKGYTTNVHMNRIAYRGESIIVGQTHCSARKTCITAGQTNCSARTNLQSQSHFFAKGLDCHCHVKRNRVSQTTNPARL